MTARRIREKSLRRREWERRLAQSHVDAKVDHILEAVRSGRVSIPAGLSRRRLRRDIQWAHTRYLTLPDLGSDARWRERYERLARIEKLARELKGLLSGETGRWVRDRISGSFPFRGEGTPRPAKHKRTRGHRSPDPAPSMRGLRHGLARLARVSRREISREVEIKTGEAITVRPVLSPSAPWPQERSAFNWLIGKELAEIYSRHFGRDAGSSRSSNGADVDGPYIRFVEAVLADLDIMNRRGGKAKSYSRAYIARELVAATAARKGNE